MLALLAGCQNGPRHAATPAGAADAAPAPLAPSSTTQSSSSKLAQSIAQETQAFSQGLADHFNQTSPTTAPAPLAVQAPTTVPHFGPNARDADPAAAMGALAMTPPTDAATAAGNEDAALALLRRRAIEHPDQPAYALALQLFETAETGNPSDPAVMKRLAPADQRIVEELATAVRELSPTPLGSSLAARAAPIIAAVEAWRQTGDLMLPRLLLASRVDSYGVYTALPAKFPYGRQGLAIIYCEVANFTSQKSTEGDESLYTTRLTQQDTLMTSDGLLVWRPNAEEVVDRSHNRRHDFYLVKKLVLPANLAVGHYTLKLTVTDNLSNKIATASLPLEIVAGQ